MLVQSGQSIPFALWIANECELSVRHAIAPSDDYAAFAARYFLFWSEKAGTPWIRQTGFELQKLGTNDLSDVAKAKAPGVFVVDTAQLAAAVPELLRTIVEWG
ncbi:hypothetical protein [Devosia ginsengisoli]|uniref:hypothetical protein n=1 Tax=Devosia ginsengisoli TaxID=400770 RepID=UPI0026E94F8F|nr:hypothetical protein [Devosia ginsengisoli]MCR6670026.1 hypothetical protein [Devosia ginsengisoli]